MSTGVEFEEDSFGHGPSAARPGASTPTYQYAPPGFQDSGNEERGMTGWFIRHHLAKTPQGAQMYLLGIVVINIIITIVALVYYL